MHSPEPDQTRRAARPPRVPGHEHLTLEDGWELARCAPDACGPSELERLQWQAIPAPSTVAQALRQLGRWQLGDSEDFDAHDWWFRTRFQALPARPGEEVALCLDGLASVAEVYLNGERLLDSASMFKAHEIDVTKRLLPENELLIHCRALGELLRARRTPRARWRTRLVANGNLRFFRTMLLGRAPGFAPAPAAVGPWRPVRLERRSEVRIDRLALRTRLCGADGVLEVQMGMRTLSKDAVNEVTLELSGPSGSHRCVLELAAQEGSASGELVIPAVARWWPHTHGDPALHDVHLHVSGPHGQITIPAGRVGFRELAPGSDPAHRIEADGLDLHLNGVRIFARGAVWTPLDLAAPEASEAALRSALEQVCEAGMNMLRIPGTSAYETPAFHDLCDELGLLVWQDFMFANMDYPIADEQFREEVLSEVEQVLEQAAGRPSLTVLCGNSEVEQQVAMLGLDPAIARGELFGDLLPELIAASGLQAIYVPSAPCGGDLPFRTDRGIANYYGVGGYRRALAEVKSAGVRFAAECLAFANVPEAQMIEDIFKDAPASVAVHHPRWKAGVPRDVGTGWDFDDVRDHYLRELYGVDDAELRRSDHERYLELSRLVSGEVMAEVFGEWRRTGSSCGGGLVLWLRDLYPGAGWGVIDQSGTPKVAYHYLARALAPVAVWMTDEGLNGVRVHIANDRPETLRCDLRLAVYSEHEHRVQEMNHQIALAGHESAEYDLEALLGRFLDATWAYRFGPPAHDVLVATLQRPGIGEEIQLLSQAFRFPLGRPHDQQTAEELGLEGTLLTCADGALSLMLRSRRLAYGVRVNVPGFHPADDALTLEPGVARTLALSPLDDNGGPPGQARLEAPPDATLTALNLRGRVRLIDPSST